MTRIIIYDCGCFPQAEDYCPAAKERKAEARRIRAERGDLHSLATTMARRLENEAMACEQWVAEHISEQQRHSKYRIIGGNPNGEVAGATGESGRWHDPENQNPRQDLRKAIGHDEEATDG